VAAEENEEAKVEDSPETEPELKVHEIPEGDTHEEKSSSLQEEQKEDHAPEPSVANEENANKD
jgi:hypothetical protein